MHDALMRAVFFAMALCAASPVHAQSTFEWAAQGMGHKS
jgi:hypothetical protein